MAALVRRSINGKLRRLVLVAVCTSTVIVAGVSSWQELSRYADAKREALLGAANGFAAASAAAVAAGDEAGMLRALTGIGRLRGVPFGAIEGRDGAVLAEIGTGARLANDLDVSDAAPGPLALLRGGTVAVRVPVVLGGETVGRLRLVGDVSDLPGRVRSVLLGTLAAGAAALVLGLLVAFRLQRRITGPLLALAGTMAAVRTSHDYASPVPAGSNDEVGLLAESFSGLMAEVRERDRALVAHRDRLEEDVAERTLDLRRATDEALAANAAKSDFLATMSHEIRTPMNGMLVMAELLAGSDLQPRQRRFAEVIARSGQSLLAIINDILDFSKIESGKLTVEEIPYGPSDVVDTVVTLFAERARSKGLDLAAFVAPDVPVELAGDPVRITQVLGNLVNNALKFTESGHVAVRMTAEDGVLRLAVHDTGIGIPADKLGSIFEAFSQADGTTARRFGGTGLGLSICRRLVEAMGGEIGVTSRDQEGSCFAVALPLRALGTAPVVPVPVAPAPVSVTVPGAATSAALREALEARGLPLADGSETDCDAVVEAGAVLLAGSRPTRGRIVAVAPMGDGAGGEALARGLVDVLIRSPVVQSEWRDVLDRLVAGGPFAPAAAAEPRRAADAMPFAGARVLVVDDSPVNLEVATEALAILGIRADTAPDGRTAIEAVFSRSYDLVLMDGSMPDLDGYQTTAAIREREAGEGRARTAIVALTAHVVGAAADAWSAAGMDGVLHKPFTVAKLTRCLAAHLSADAIAARVAVPAEPAPGSEDALLDAETLDNLDEMAASGATGFIAHVLSLFGRDGPPTLAALRRSAADGDARAAAAAAHKLKSMSLNVGGRRLAARLARVEEEAAERALLPTPAAVDGLDALLADTTDALSARFGSGGNVDREAA